MVLVTVVSRVADIVRDWCYQALTTVTTRVQLRAMSYRPSSNPPVTAWARHLDKVMREQGWSRVRLFEEIAPEMGWAPKSRSAMLPLLEDREPTEAQAQILARHFGEPPVTNEPAPDKEGTGSTAEIVAAIREQTMAMRELVEELRLSRAEQVGMNEGLVAVAAQVARVLEARVGN